MYKKQRFNGGILLVAWILAYGFISIESVQAQTQVSGTVTTEAGEPLPGVNIVVEGTSEGANTDVDGSFELDVPSLNETLVFSYVGYQTLEIELNGRSELNVEMIEQAYQGDELVVTAFGIERAQRGLSYSTEGVNTEQLTEARELNVVTSLQGRVAGLNINRASTGVGGEARVVLRGNRSFSGDSTPLVVVDGVPIRGSLSDISPDEIESINVLKGANAAASPT